MRLVLDASVAVAAARLGEPAHGAARERVETVLSRRDDILVPTLFSVEVAASLARIGVALPAIRRYLKELLGAAAVVPLGPRAARQARETAMRWKLRAAEAVYVWLAAREDVALCTLDAEIAYDISACEHLQREGDTVSYFPGVETGMPVCPYGGMMVHAPPARSSRRFHASDERRQRPYRRIGAPDRGRAGDAGRTDGRVRRTAAVTGAGGRAQRATGRAGAQRATLTDKRGAAK